MYIHTHTYIHTYTHTYMQVKIAGHILADEGEGEVPCIPEMICVVSTEAERQRGGGVNEADAAAHDPIVCLINGIVQLVLVLDEGRAAGRKEVSSPLLAQTCTWFFSRYLYTSVYVCMYVCMYVCRYVGM
jgi:hypothetical protein